MPPRSDKSRQNVHQIQEMFAALGLPVCDDEAAIKAACEEQRGTRNRELNSTKGSVAARAQQWFDDVNNMLNKRDELLEVVFQEFCRLGDTVLRADIDGGRTALGADTQMSLRDIAMNWCRARSDLANAWLAEFLERRGLRDNEELEQPKRVTEFKASPRRGRVMLTWTVPEDRYDEVRIVRVVESSTDPADEIVVYQGTDASFLDTSVSPKVHYTYRAYTLFEGHKSLTATVAHTQRKGSSGKRMKPSFVGVLLAAGCVLILAYDKKWGDDVIMGTLAQNFSQSASALAEGSSSAETADTAGEATPVSNQNEAAMGVPSDEQSSETDTDDSAEDGSRPNPRVWMSRPPTLAFAGETLSIELDMTETMKAELVDLKLEGLEFKRFEFDTNPPLVRMSVLQLPGNDDEGNARWSFRLTTADGRLSNKISGSCQVVR